MNRALLKRYAREDIRANYVPWLLVSVVSIAIYFAQAWSVSENGVSTDSIQVRWLEIINLIMAVPFTRLAIDLSTRNYHDASESLFQGHRWLRNIGASLLVSLFTFLWTLLLIIPGIVKAYSYSMVPYILADDDDISITEAIEKSVWMTNGYKMDLFILDLSFILWEIFSSFTFGLAAFYYVPYKKATWTHFYLEMSEE